MPANTRDKIMDVYYFEALLTVLRRIADSLEQIASNTQE